MIFFCVTLLLLAYLSPWHWISLCHFNFALCSWFGLTQISILNGQLYKYLKQIYKQACNITNKTQLSPISQRGFLKFPYEKNPILYIHPRNIWIWLYMMESFLGSSQPVNKLRQYSVCKQNPVFGGSEVTKSHKSRSMVVLHCHAKFCTKKIKWKIHWL